MLRQTKTENYENELSSYAKTQLINVHGDRYAYRVLGNKEGIPLIMLQHFTGNMKNWNPNLIGQIVIFVFIRIVD